MNDRFWSLQTTVSCFWRGDSHRARLALNNHVVFRPLLPCPILFWKHFPTYAFWLKCPTVDGRRVFRPGTTALTANPTRESPQAWINPQFSVYRFFEFEVLRIYFGFQSCPNSSIWDLKFGQIRTCLKEA